MGTAIRIRMMISGTVQGIGFRPFIYRLANELSLCGWISNIPEGVIIEVEGKKDSLISFKSRMYSEKPSLASIYSCELVEFDAVGYPSFEIRSSSDDGKKRAVILPDLALCPDCLRELFDPSNRRFRYPFINCTNCGPRWSIIKSVPYDRINTSMKEFTMCPECQKEYDDPSDRRFHAQPNACPKCGPAIQLLTNNGEIIAERETAIMKTLSALNEGKIIAVKGIGGFHLMADPFNDDAVQLLRSRKQREQKPLALMMPSIEAAKQYCSITSIEEEVLCSVHAPIVLTKKIMYGNSLSPKIAPNNPLLGILLPYTPLHQLIMTEWGRPLIATSGNISDETICTENGEALNRLSGIADFFLVHNRPIIHHADDSIIRIIAGREVVIRRGRGLAPLPVMLPMKTEQSILSVGGHLKNTVALNVGDAVFVSQHIGDLETEQSFQTFQSILRDLTVIYESTPVMIAADKHPEYLSTKYAERSGIPLFQIQHHAAHLFSCMAENQLQDNVLGVSWDGTGYGDDGTIWGGEFFTFKEQQLARVGTFRSFPLPGGSTAMKEPRRSALGVLFEGEMGKGEPVKDSYGMYHFSEKERTALWQAMRNHLNSPRTSSVGRLFDAVASLIDVRQINGYEGQAALELEGLIKGEIMSESYPFQINFGNNRNPLRIIDWKEMIAGILDDVRCSTSKSIIAQKFHNTLAEMIVAMAKHISIPQVVLSGGCFQNAYLTEQTIARLQQEGFRPYWHQRFPPNDGGLSLGQIYGAILLNHNERGRSSLSSSAVSAEIGVEQCV